MNTVSDIIEALGRRPIMDKLGVSSQSVSGAIAAGQFPAAWYAALCEMADNAGCARPALAAFRWKGIEERAA